MKFSGVIQINKIYFLSEIIFVMIFLNLSFEVAVSLTVHQEKSSILTKHLSHLKNSTTLYLSKEEKNNIQIINRSSVVMAGVE